MATSFMIAERYVQQSHVDADGRGRVEWAHDPPRHVCLIWAGPALRRRRRHVDGGRLDAVRPARHRGRGGPHRRHRRRGRGLAAAGLGGRHPAGVRAAATLGLPGAHPGRLHRARRRHRWRDPALHGRGRAAAPRHRQRAGVPRPARRGRRAGSWSQQDLAGPRGRRRADADPALAGRGRPARRRVRAGRRGLLGGVHPAHPARRRRRRGHQGAGRHHARRRARPRPSWRGRARSAG